MKFYGVSGILVSFIFRHTLATCSFHVQDILNSRLLSKNELCAHHCTELSEWIRSNPPTALSRGNPEIVKHYIVVKTHVYIYINIYIYIHI